MFNFGGRQAVCGPGASLKGEGSKFSGESSCDVGGSLSESRCSVDSDIAVACVVGIIEFPIYLHSWSWVVVFGMIFN